MRTNLESSKFEYWQYNVLAFFAFGCYFNSIFGTFTFDDAEAIVKNKDVLITTPLPNVFKNDFWGTEIVSNYSHKSYRPLTILTYRLNTLLSNSELVPLHFHVFNVILYIILCIFTLPVFALFLKGKRSKSVDAAFLSSLLFTAHPIHTEVVSSIVGRADILAALLVLISFLLYDQALQYQSNNIFLYFALLFSVIATFCKETAIMGLALYCVYDIMYTYGQKYKRNSITEHYFIYRFVSVIFVGLSTLIFRLWIMNFEGPSFTSADNPAAFSDSVFTKIFTYNYIYLINVILLIWPEWLCFDWSMGCIPLIKDIYDVRIIYVMMFWCILILFLYKIIRKVMVAGIWHMKPTVMAISFIVLPFVPASNLIINVGFVIAERILLLPSMGFCFLVVTGYKKILKKFKLRKYISSFFFLSIVFALRTILRNADWLSEESLFNSALTVCPSNAKVHYNIAKVSADNNKNVLAINEYRIAIELNENYEQAMNNLANLLREDKHFLEAEALLRRAVEVRPNFAAAWMNLGIVLTNLNRPEEAEKCYLTALSFRNKYSDCYYNLGNLYLDLKRNEEAIKAWELAVLHRPTHTSAWSNMLVLLDTLKGFDSVQEIGKIALMHNPTSAALHFSLANTLGKVKHFEHAEKHFLEALNLNSNNALYYANLGVLYHRWKKPKKAIQMYKKALQINPNMKATESNLKKLMNM